VLLAAFGEPLAHPLRAGRGFGHRQLPVMKSRTSTSAPGREAVSEP
jgi:hypothetical protein